MYIRSVGISATNNDFEKLFEQAAPVQYTQSRINCADMNIDAYVAPNVARRMSRIIKMGIAAAMKCLEEAGVKDPGAIIMGTAYGCLDDTGAFLKRQIENNETLLTPTAFIQSTHNTVGGQIGLLLKCHAYNNTFVHRGFSFENALQDAQMLLNENAADNILAGAADEITASSHAILSRFGLYKRTPVDSHTFYTQGGKGTIHGEGAAFFMLSNTHSNNDYAQLLGIETLYKPSGSDVVYKRINDFLSAHGLTAHDIDLLITGRNGDEKTDDVYALIEQKLFSTTPVLKYKYWCGEYPTATAYALWLAAHITKHQKVPGIPLRNDKKVKYILVYNHLYNTHHSWQLIAAC